MRELPSCRRFLGGSSHFSASLPMFAFVRKFSLMNPYLDSACAGRRFTPWLTRQGTVEASTRGGADASLLSQQLDGRLASADSLRTAARVRLDAISSAEEALRNLGTFDFVASHLFSAGGRHSSTIIELFHLIERLEELHTDVQ